jgi:hypothetical protein
VKVSLKEQIRSKDFQEKWRSSPASIQDVIKETNCLFDEIGFYFQTSLEVKVERGDFSLLYNFHNLEIKLVLTEHNNYGSVKTPKDRILIVQIFQQNGHAMKTKLSENFNPDVSIDGKIGWSPVSSANHFLTSTEIYEKLIQYLTAILRGEDAKF